MSETQNMPAQKIRYQYIDRAKAIAIMGVVFLHVNTYCFDNFRTDFSYSTLCSFLHLYQQPLFMFLSGLVASSKIIGLKDLPNEIYKKLRVLVVPFLVIGLTFAYCSSKGAEGFFMSDAKLGFWYLWALFVMYITHFLYELTIYKPSRTIIRDLLWGGTLSALLLCAKIFTPAHICSLLSLTAISWLYPFFFCGVMIKKYKLHELIFKNDVIYTICTLYCITYMVLYAVGMRLPVKVAIFVFAPGAIPVIMNLLAKYEHQDSWFLNKLDFIGRNTLDVYTYHFFFLNIFTCRWLGDWIKANYVPMLEFFVAIIPTILFLYAAIGLGQIIRRSNILKQVIYGLKDKGAK